MFTNVYNFQRFLPIFYYKNGIVFNPYFNYLCKLIFGE
jgi:hypothetical protein